MPCDKIQRNELEQTSLTRSRDLRKQTNLAPVICVPGSASTAPHRHPHRAAAARARPALAGSEDAPAPTVKTDEAAAPAKVSFVLPPVAACLCPPRVHAVLAVVIRH